jgi:biopolymer transport protein ExbD
MHHIFKQDIMSEVNIKTDLPRKNRSRKLETKVDLTAMVDLGFLLITFFIMTTSMSKPKSMEIIKPVDGEPMPIKESYSLTLLLSPNDKIYFYSKPDEVMERSLVDSTHFGPKGVRKIVMAKQKMIADEFGDGKVQNLFVSIKPMKNTSLEKLVDILDEMTICSVKRFAILAPNLKVDYALQKQYEIHEPNSNH